METIGEELLREEMTVASLSLIGRRVEQDWLKDLQRGERCIIWWHDNKGVAHWHAGTITNAQIIKTLRLKIDADVHKIDSTRYDKRLYIDIELLKDEKKYRLWWLPLKGPGPAMKRK